jgi:uncharacterized membrane protein
MNEVILLLLGIVGIFAIACSIALITLGKMIDRYPHEGEEVRERSLSSPKESTMIAVILFWAMFIPGGWAVLQETRFTLIVGITTIFAICLFMLTALVFSFAVLSTMKQREKALRKEAMERRDAPLMPPARQITPVPRTALASKLYKRPVADLMFNAFLKKD